MSFGIELDFNELKNWMFTFRPRSPLILHLLTRYFSEMYSSLPTVHWRVPYPSADCPGSSSAQANNVYLKHKAMAEFFQQCRIFFCLMSCHVMLGCQFPVRWNENYILKQTMGDSASVTFRVNHLISSQLLQLHVIYMRGIYKLLLNNKLNCPWAIIIW